MSCSNSLSWLRPAVLKSTSCTAQKTSPGIRSCRYTRVRNVSEMHTELRTQPRRPDGSERKPWRLRFRPSRVAVYLGLLAGVSGFWYGMWKILHLLT